jgi:hypothetical protein
MINGIKKHLKEYCSVYAIPLIVAGVVGSFSVADSLSKKERIDDIILRHQSNQTVMIRPIDGFQYEAWVDEGNDGVLDNHYRRFPTSPWVMGLSKLPLKVTAEDQEKYKHILSKSQFK